MAGERCIICAKHFENYSDWEMHWNEELLMMLEEGRNNQSGSSQDSASASYSIIQCSSAGNIGFGGEVCKTAGNVGSDDNCPLDHRKRAKGSMSPNIEMYTKSTYIVSYGNASCETSEKNSRNQNSGKLKLEEKRISRSPSKGDSLAHEKTPRMTEHGLCPISNELFPISLLQQHVEQELDNLESVKEKEPSVYTSDSISGPLGSDPSHPQKAVQRCLGRCGFSWINNVQEPFIPNSTSEMQGSTQPLKSSDKSRRASIGIERKDLLRCFSWKNGDSRALKRKGGANNTTCSGSLLVLGDDPAPRQRSRGPNKKKILKFNHYADGGGWWDEGSAGVDYEALGSAEIWEGVGFASLGNLQQSN